MTWSARLWVAALAAALQLGLIGCSSARWPVVEAQAAHSFVSQRAVQTVDILPLDVQLWTYPGNGEAVEEMAIQFYQLATQALDVHLAQRGYLAASHMAWDGSYTTPAGAVHQGMSQDAIEATSYSLSGYGHAMATTGADLLVPYLPYRLGAATRSDATLYVGGWAYVGDDDSDSTGVKVAKGVALALVVVVVVAVVVAAVSGGKGGGGGSGAGKVASGAGKGASGAGKAASSAVSSAGRVAASTVSAAGRMTGAALRGAARAAPHVMEAAFHGIDMSARAGTHIEVYAGRPDYLQTDKAPTSGRSRMYLEMTLIDNATGMALWHARETFPARATSPDDMQRVFTHMIAALPAR